MRSAKRSFIAGAMLLSSTLAAAPAYAAATIHPDGTVTFDDGAGSNSVDVVFNGLGGDPKALTPGLSAFLTLTLTGIAGDTFNFSYSLENTSTVANTRVSGFGFDVDPDANGVSSTGVFDLSQLGANFASIGAEVCLNGGPGNCPESNPANSVLFGTTGSGTFSLTFNDDDLTSITLGNFLDRYQGFSTTNVNRATVTSAIGVGTPVGPVPEPATWAMMLVGFGGIGMAMRRRRTSSAMMQIA